jgi:hypothetical protein
MKAKGLTPLLPIAMSLDELSFGSILGGIRNRWTDKVINQMFATGCKRRECELMVDRYT